ncbi:MAG: cobalamin/Fe(3+)-siderophore ABC transporter ATP-binding protein, partial [Rhodococcus sp. (in: high G+C Gram-positive bacteria)]
IVMKQGEIVASGRPQDVISEQLLLDVFGLEATVIDDPMSDRPLIVPIGTRHVYGSVGGPVRSESRSAAVASTER